MKSHWNIDNEQLNVLKIAYKNLYYKSRELSTFPEKQEEILDYLVKDQFVKVLTKLVDEDEYISEENSVEFFKYFQDLTFGIGNLNGDQKVYQRY